MKLGFKIKLKLNLIVVLKLEMFKDIWLKNDDLVIDLEIILDFW